MNLMATFNFPTGCSLADIDPGDLAERQEQLERCEEERYERRRDDDLFREIETKTDL